VTVISLNTSLYIHHSSTLSCNPNSTSNTVRSRTSTLTSSYSTANNYTVTVTGTSRSLSHTTATITVQVVDFTIFASPTTVNTTPGVAATSMITVMPVNGFTGTVALTTSVSPTTGLTCSVSPTSITGGSGTSTLSCSGTGGTYTVTVTGTNAALSHNAILTVNVQDFTLTASPTSIVSTTCRYSAPSPITT